MLENKVISLKNKLEKLWQERAKMRNNGNLPGQLADDEKRSSEEEDPSNPDSDEGEDEVASSDKDGELVPKSKTGNFWPTYLPKKSGEICEISRSVQIWYKSGTNLITLLLMVEKSCKTNPNPNPIPNPDPKCIGIRKCQVKHAIIGDKIIQSFKAWESIKKQPIMEQIYR